MIYLDANASQPLRPEARQAMLAALATTGNPSSVHAAGRAARRLLEDARETLAAKFGGEPSDLVFTSGGTEADALAGDATNPLSLYKSHAGLALLAVELEQPERAAMPLFEFET